MTGGVYSACVAMKSMRAAIGAPQPSQCSGHRLADCERAELGLAARRSAPCTAPGGSSDSTGWPALTHSPTRK